MSDEIKILEAFSIKIDGKIVLTNNLDIIKKKEKEDDNENKPKIPINIKDIEGLQYLEE
jgi:hypothetical protein